MRGAPYPAAARPNRVGQRLSGSGLAGASHRRFASDLAVLGVVAAVVGLFAVSPEMLESRGIAYLTSGGGVFSKFHPSTFVAVAAFVLRCLATRSPIRTGWRLMTEDAGAVLLLSAFVVTAVYAVLVSHTPVTPLVDTFALPVLLFLLLRDLDPAVMHWLALMVAGILCINAVMALIEMHRGAHFLTITVPEGASSDPRRGDATFDWRAQLALDWRATALLGHPLVNGLIAGAFILCLAARGARWLPALVRVSLLLLQAVSMFAFGARTALVLTIAFAGWLGLDQVLDLVRRGRRIGPRELAFALLAIGVVVGACGVLLQTGFLDRTLERFAEDGGSATTRITMFNLFQPLSLSDMLLAPSSEVVATWQRLEGLEFGIESSWVGLALTYGLVVTAILVVGLLAFSISVIRASGRGTTIVLIYFFILVSAAASMSGKTTVFAMVVILTLIFLRKDERRRPLWPPARVGWA